MQRSVSDYQGIQVRTGVDIVSVSRVMRLLDENPNIIDSLFTNREISYCRDKSRKCYEHMAARFAAKEAVFKALSACPGHRLSWTEVEIINELAGRPYVVLHGDTALLVQRSGLISLDISLSHTTDLAIAQVVTVWQGNGQWHEEGNAKCASI